MIKIIITGDKYFDNYQLLKNTMNDIIHELKCRNMISNQQMEKLYPSVEFLSGKSTGAERLGEKYADRTIWSIKRFSEEPDVYGNGAELCKIKEMIKYASTNSHGLLIAFWDGKSKNTESIIKLAKTYGIETRIVEYSYRNMTSNTIEDLKSYKGGDNRDVPICDLAINHMQYLIAQCAMSKLPVPSIFPWFGGEGAQAEWSYNGWYIEIDSSPRGISGFFLNEDSISCMFNDIKDAFFMVKVFLSQVRN